MKTLTQYGRRVIGGACLSVALATLVGCPQAPAQNKTEPKLPVVIVSNPIEEIVVDYEEFTGRVDAANKVAIQAMVTGYLDKINFVDGEDIPLDKVLFEIDPRIYDAKFKSAQADLESAKASAIRAEALYKRALDLLPTRATAQEEVDTKKGDWAVARAAIGVAEAQLQMADVNLKYTKVKSPIAGRASRRLIDAGNMVKANETILTWIYQIDPMYGYFDVDEGTVMKLRHLINAGKMKSYRDGKIYVDIGLADEEGYGKSVKGAYINWVDNVLDSGTGTLKFRCILPQPRNAKDEPMVLVSPGMFGRLKLPTSVPHSAILISEKALASDQGEKYLLVVNAQKKIERRNVKLGQLYNGLRVVENSTGDKSKDLKPTDLVVISGLQRVQVNKEVTWNGVVPMPRAGVFGDTVVDGISSPSLSTGKSGN
ncbi:MAG TPA: efflux RND transporter periplasmic adaptor subunit [Gemmataceae bacterium]|nr:efflux RND transporter periplasmic adaptor subunit [Gemmataceae bacterium]